MLRQMIELDIRDSDRGEGIKCEKGEYSSARETDRLDRARERVRKDIENE